MVALENSTWSVKNGIEEKRLSQHEDPFSGGSRPILTITENIVLPIINQESIFLVIVDSLLDIEGSQTRMKEEE